MYKRILVALDGSETSRRAADEAIKLSSCTGGKLFLLSVIDNTFLLNWPVSGRKAPTHLMEPMEDYLRQAVEAFSDEIEKECGEKGVECEAVIRTGNPVEEIVKTAERLNAELIVLGSHGRSAVSATLLGSVSMGVIHNEKRIPVLIVRK